jgi:hypothetical protein
MVTNNDAGTNDCAGLYAEGDVSADPACVLCNRRRSEHNVADD